MQFRHLELSRLGSAHEQAGKARATVAEYDLHKQAWEAQCDDLNRGGLLCESIARPFWRAGRALAGT